jgi:hypothetical protein
MEPPSRVARARRCGLKTRGPRPPLREARKLAATPFLSFVGVRSAVLFRQVSETTEYAA